MKRDHSDKKISAFQEFQPERSKPEKIYLTTVYKFSRLLG